MFIKPAEGRITSSFGVRTHPVTGERSTMHWGIDIEKVGNVPIFAAASGTISRVQQDGTFGTYGNLIMIVHNISGRTYETVYAHLKSIGVRNGQVVKAGQIIGVMGSTGSSTRQHLHFEIHIGRWNNKYSNAENPVLFMANPAIKELQQLLVNIGYKIIVDGMNGPDTEAAVKDFQKINGLVVDGIAGPLTMAAINNAIEKKGDFTLSQYNELNKKIEALESKLGNDRAVSSSFVEDWKWAADKGLLDGSRPSHPVTREQLSAVLHRYNQDNSLTGTAKKDLKILLEKAFNEGVFSEDHSGKVETMPEHQIINLLISIASRTFGESEDK